MPDPYNGEERRSDRTQFNIEALQRGQDEIRAYIWGQPGGNSLREDFTAGITRIEALILERDTEQNTRLTTIETSAKVTKILGVGLFIVLSAATAIAALFF